MVFLWRISVCWNLFPLENTSLLKSNNCSNASGVSNLSETVCFSLRWAVLLAAAELEPMGFWHHHLKPLRFLNGKMNCSLKFSQNFLLSDNKWDSSVSFPGRKWGFKFPRPPGPHLHLAKCHKFFWDMYLGLLTCIIRLAISAVLDIGDYWKILHSFLTPVIPAFKTAHTVFMHSHFSQGQTAAMCWGDEQFVQKLQYLLLIWIYLIKGYVYLWFKEKKIFNFSPLNKGCVNSLDRIDDISCTSLAGNNNSFSWWQVKPLWRQKVWFHWNSDNLWSTAFLLFPCVTGT